MSWFRRTPRLFRTALGPSLHQRVWARLLSHLRYRFLIGIIFLVPILITYIVLTLAFNFLDGVLDEVVVRLFDVNIAGLGIVALILLVYVSGLVVPNFISRGIIRSIESVVSRIPGLRQIYSASRQLVTSVSGQATKGFNRVVMIEYPHPGLWAVGFLMGLTLNEEERTMAVVYIPTSPTPTSGWVAIMDVENVYDTDLPVNTAMQMVLSGGIMVPAQIAKRPLKEFSPGAPLQGPAESQPIP